MTRPRRRAACAAALIAASLVGGCILSGVGGDEALAFSHRIHVVEQELDCAMCHEDLAFDDDPGMPAIDTCLFCHDEIDAEKPEERRVDALFTAPEDGGEPAYDAARVSALDDEVVFSHLAHVEAELDCADCHLGVERAQDVGSALAVPMARCVDCHEERAQPTGCAACHTEVDETWAPPNHSQAWDRMHGRVARDAGGFHGASSGVPASESCALCHTEDTCAACHRVEPPRDHTHGFRLKGHGLLARMDRQRCAACHEPASCVRCHAETRPLSHGGMWGGTKSMHCLGCHTPLEQNGCATCHEATPSHAAATPMPRWHVPSMNCTACHGVGGAAPMPHVDNGESCLICHF